MSLRKVALLILAACVVAMVLRSAHGFSSASNSALTSAPDCAGPCSGGIDERSTTTASFYGYYTTRNSVDEDGQGHICPTFVVTNTNEPLSEYFIGLARNGNTVDSVDAAGHLLLRIDLAALSGAERSRIVASSKERTITLKVQKDVLEGKGAGGCSSFVTIKP